MPGSAGLGALLRECREAKELSADDLSRATRIVPRLLLALEEERYSDLPAPVFVRGFIRAFCAAVGEPPERALTLYEASVEAAGSASPIPRTVLAEAPGPPRRLRWRRLAPQLLAGGLLVVIGGAAYLLASSAATGPGEAPRPAADQPPPAQPVGVRPEPAASPARPTAAPHEAPRAHVLVARAHEETWVSVRAEDGTGSQELLAPGSVREWQSGGRFTVTVGNAGGLTLELDGVALPPLGDRGQVVRDVRLLREPAP